MKGGTRGGGRKNRSIYGIGAAFYKSRALSFGFWERHECCRRRARLTLHGYASAGVHNTCGNRFTVSWPARHAIPRPSSTLAPCGPRTRRRPRDGGHQIGWRWTGTAGIGLCGRASPGIIKTLYHLDSALKLPSTPESPLPLPASSLRTPPLFMHACVCYSTFKTVTNAPISVFRDPSRRRRRSGCTTGIILSIPLHYKPTGTDD